MGKTAILARWETTIRPARTANWTSRALTPNASSELRWWGGSPSVSGRLVALTKRDSWSPMIAMLVRGTRFAPCLFNCKIIVQYAGDSNYRIRICFLRMLSSSLTIT